MRARGLLVAAACGLAACGGGDDHGSPAPGPSAAEKAYLARMTSLCVRATQADAARPADAFAHYKDFVRSLKKVRAPQRFAADQRRAVAIQERQRRTFQALQPTFANPDMTMAYGRDDAVDARLGLVDCIWPPDTLQPRDAYPQATRGSLRALRPALERICADNAARTAYARTLIARDASLGGDAATAARGRVAVTSSERLPRLVVRLTPTDGGPAYGGWRDALKTVGNLRRLAAGTSDAKRAEALRAQAERTATAARAGARRLGLAQCAKRPA